MTNNVKNRFEQAGSGTDNDLLLDGDTIYGKDSIITSLGDSGLGESDYSARMRVFVTLALSQIEPKPYAIKSTNYTLTSEDYYIEVDTAGVTITLPTAIGVAGKTFEIDNSSIGSMTLATTSSQTINDELTQIIPTDSNIKVTSNGTNWRIK